MTEKKTIDEIIDSYPLSGAYLETNTHLRKAVTEMMEAYAAQQSKMPTREKCDKKMFEILSQPTSLGKDLRGVRSPAMMMAEYSEWLRNQIG